MSDINHLATDNIICPYCRRQYEDCIEFGENGIEKCDNCGEEFSFEREINVIYYTRKLIGE